jgi:DNA-binding transcriptional ArsR family regulator
MRVLSDTTRINLLLFLALKGGCNVANLCEGVGAVKPRVSHRLGILRRARMVKTRRQGRAIYYRLADAASGRNKSLQILAGGARVIVEVLT